MSLQDRSVHTEFTLPPLIDFPLSDEELGLVGSSVRNQRKNIDEGELQLIRSQVFDFAKFEDWQSVVNSLKKLVKLDSSARTYTLLGLAYYKIDELHKAANALEKSVNLNSQDSKTHFFLGFLYFLLGKLTKAIASFRSSVRLNPKEATVHFCLAVTHHSLKHWQLAIDSYKEALRLSGNFIPLYLFFYLASSYEGLGKEKPSTRESAFHDAITAYQQVLKIDPKHIQALNALGGIYHSLGRLEEAEKVLAKALKLDPHNAEALNQLRLVKEDQLAQRLFESGHLKKINKRITDFTPYQKRKPIKIKGEPLSETVIEDRR